MSNGIDIGKAVGGKRLLIDLKTLRRTRLLVQANSGGGKSWLLRRIAEQMFGKVPVWIIDPEGEFASLREKFDFVLVGKGGETPADPRYAEAVSHKLRELNASVVFDLYELKPYVRHHYVKVLLEALMNAPKTLWRPLVLKVDEAHTFAPEKGQGESEAASAMQDIATRGRKRGICLAVYLQRLARLSKTVSAELLNRLVGMTFEDVDVERAETVLSVAKADREQFRRDIKHLSAGQFYGLGPAIAKDRTLVLVGDVQTTHPDPDDDAKHVNTPPPPTAKIKALLPKLADLPKEVEEKAKTEAELRTEVRTLKAQLAARPKEIVQAPAPAARVEVKRVEVPVVKGPELTRVERALAVALQVAGKVNESVEHLRGFSDLIQKRVQEIERKGRPPHQVGASIPSVTGEQGKVGRASTPPPAPRIAHRRTIAPTNGTAADPSEHGALSKMATAILCVLSQHPDGCVAGKITLLTGYRYSGGFQNSLGELRTRGFIEGRNTEVMRITEAGLAVIAGIASPLPEGEELVQFWLNHRSFGPMPRAILRAILEKPDGMVADELMEATGYAYSGGFQNALGELRTAGVLIGKNKERMRACDELLACVAR